MSLLFTLALLAAAIGQSLWVVIYATGPWRDMPVGWVWLFKGTVLAVLLDMVLIDRMVVDAPVWLWVTMMCAFAVAIWVWVITTWQARRSDNFLT